MPYSVARTRARALGLLLGGTALFGCRPESGHDLSSEQLTAVVAREQATLQPCYQTALDKSPYEHEFRIQATVNIRPDGSVSKVVLDQPGMRGVGACVEQTIRGWKFPPARDPTRASLPIIFQPKVVKTLPEGFKLPQGFQVLPQPD